MSITRSRTDFLSNSENKQRFVEGLVEYLLEKGINAKQSNYNDADAEVVKTALELSRTKPTVCVGKDSDLLVLLLSEEGTINPKLLKQCTIKWHVEAYHVILNTSIRCSILFLLILIE